MVINIVKYIQGGINSALNFWRNIMLKLIKNICDVKKTWNIDVRGVQLVPEEVSQSSVVVTYHGENDVDISVHGTFNSLDSTPSVAINCDITGYQLLNLIDAETTEYSALYQDFIVSDGTNERLNLSLGITSNGPFILGPNPPSEAEFSTGMELLQFNLVRAIGSANWRFDENHYDITASAPYDEYRLFFPGGNNDISDWQLIYDMSEGSIVVNRTDDGLILVSMSAGKYKDGLGRDYYILSSGNSVETAPAFSTAHAFPTTNFLDSDYTVYIGVHYSDASDNFVLVMTPNNPDYLSNGSIVLFKTSDYTTATSGGEQVIVFFAPGVHTELTPVYSYATLNDLTQE